MLFCFSAPMGKATKDGRSFSNPSVSGGWPVTTKMTASLNPILTPFSPLRDTDYNVIGGKGQKVILLHTIATLG